MEVEVFIKEGVVCLFNKLIKLPIWFLDVLRKNIFVTFYEI